MGLKTIHAGHGGVDPGACANGYREADIARTITKKMCQITGAYDATDNTAVSVNDNLAKIVRNVNGRNPSANDWNISNHLNAATPSATGVEVWYYEGDEEGRKKAAEVSAAIANVLKIPNRGAKGTKNLYVINNTNGHTLLIEWCFITNAGDIQRLLNNMDSAVNAALKCFGYGSGTTVPPTTSNQNNKKNGEVTMMCTFQINKRPTVYFYNGDRIVALNHPDQLKELRKIYKDNNGKDMPHYQYSSNIPWYWRIDQVTKMKDWDGKVI